MFASVVTFGASVDGEARAILAEADPEGDGGAFAEARDWLLDFLVDGPKSARDVRAGATAAAISWRTVRRAKDALKVMSRKSSMNGGWEWLLPQASNDPEGADAAE